jgi:outer membrane biosynthesis protein TonB
MTASSRRALPWLISIGAHLVVLATVGLLLAPTASIALPPQVEISLVGAPGPGRGALRSGGAAATAVPASQRSGSSPVAAGGEARSTSPSAPLDSFPSAGTQSAPPSDSLPAPAAEDVLADVASLRPETGGSPSGTTLGWEGMARKLIRKRSPEFPTVLSAIGQEIEGEARITVAPSGIVSRVEITRSSGYIEIDASVEAALRDYLFSRVDGRIDTVGTVHFRFRLEKQD